MSDVPGMWADFVRGGTAAPNVVPGRQANSTLDKDAFLRLLITQLQHQNPLEPMDDRDFIAQMAQFSSLEQMQNMNQTLVQGQAFSMVGKAVIGTTFNQALNRFEQIGGEVSHVIMRNGEAILMVGGREMRVSDIEEIFDVRLSSMHSTILTSQSLALVGRFVQSIIYNDDGMPIDYIEGRVDHVRFENGRPVLVVGNRDIQPANVSAVADSNIIINRIINTPDFGSGVITGIDFRAGRPQVMMNDEIDGTGTVRFIPLDSVAHLSDALRQEGQVIGHNNIVGEVSSIVINNGRVYFRVEQADGTFENIRFTDSWRAIPAHAVPPAATPPSTTPDDTNTNGDDNGTDTDTDADSDPDSTP